MANLILPRGNRLYLPGNPQAFTADAYDYHPVFSVSSPGFNDNNVPGNALTHAVTAQSGYSDVGWGATGDGTAGNTSRYRYTHSAPNTTTLIVCAHITVRPYNASYISMLVEQTYNPNYWDNANKGAFNIIPYYANGAGGDSGYWAVNASGYVGGMQYGGCLIPAPRVGIPLTLVVVFDRSIYTGFNIVRAVCINGVDISRVYASVTDSSGMEGSLFLATDTHINARGIDQGSPSLFNYATITHAIATFNTADTAFARDLSPASPRRVLQFGGWGWRCG